MGRVVARFPSPGVEKEFARATGVTETTGLTDRETLHTVLSKPENRYLARKICWALTIEGLPAYVLFPRHRGDLEALVEATRVDLRQVGGRRALRPDHAGG